jgi:adenylate cyclase
LPLNRAQRQKLKSIFHIGIYWAIANVVFSIHNHIFLLSTQSSGFEQYDFWVTLVTNILVIPVAAFLAGGTIVYFIKEHVRRLPLWLALLADTVIIVVLIVLITIPGSMLYNSLFYRLYPWDNWVVVKTWEFFFSYGLLYIVFFWSFVSAVTLVALQVGEKYGPGNFIKLLRGKYYRPKVEKRVFMFLDIRSSTAIAEKLGHEKWFALLNDFFNDITEPIINNEGEIYQYVGDEVIISWPFDRGFSNRNCINCFFDITNMMEARANDYFDRYGVVLTFKAAIHSGQVAVGEIGKIKKDIIFTGDVLNTTSRIQDLCNTYRADLLVSQDVLDKIDSVIGFDVIHMGFVELRGRNQPVSVFQIRPSTYNALAAQSLVG